MEKQSPLQKNSIISLTQAKIMKIIWVTHSDVSEREIEEAVLCEIDGIRLRCKELPDEELIDLARAARAITHRAGKFLTINSSIAIAQEVKADGIHLPESMIEHRASLPVNISVHSLQAAKRAQASGANAITFGPIFFTPSKAIYGKPQGLQKLKEVIEAVSIPVYAIGGITLDNLDSCIQCGASGVMMQRPITSMIKRRLLCP